MFCENCGNQLNDEDLFCTKCGEKIKEEVTTIKIQKVQEPKERAKSESTEKIDGKTTKTNEKKKSIFKKVICVIILIVIGVIAVKLRGNVVGNITGLFKNTNTDSADKIPGSETVSLLPEYKPNLNQYEDDLVIEFECEEFEKIVRKHIEKEEGTITYADVKELEYLYDKVKAVESSVELKYFSSLRELTMITKEKNLDHLKKLKGLEYIDLVFYEKIENIDFVDGLERLSSFHIKASPGNDRKFYSVDLTVLSKLERLQNLSIEYFYISDSKFLEKMDALEKLSLVLVNSFNFEPVGEIPGLRYLSVFYYDEENADEANYIFDLSPIAKCKELEILFISLNDMTNTDRIILEPISKCNNLKNLTVSMDELVYDYSFMKELGKLEHVCLFSKLKDDSVLEKCKNLTELQLMNVEKMNFDSDVLGNLVDLKKITLFNNYDLQVLTKLKKLEEVHIQYNEQLTDASIFKELSKLKRLTIVGCDNLSDISVLADLPSLNYLYISGCDGIEQNEIDAVKEVIEKNAQKQGE